jgi:hypothetical protein
MGWAKLWAIFHLKHLVTLLPVALLSSEGRSKRSFVIEKNTKK